eukprot:gene1300-2513_t
MARLSDSEIYFDIIPSLSLESYLSWVFRRKNSTAALRNSCAIFSNQQLMGFLSTVVIFIFGALCGCGLALVAAILILSQGHPVETDKNVETKEQLKEGAPTEGDLKLLTDALKFLRGEATENDNDSFPSEEKAIGTQQMDKNFGEYSKDSKERQKHVKALNLFFADYMKVSKNYSRDLAKLSQTAESYVKAENDKYLDKWWNALSIAMDHLSQDQDYLSDVLEHEICYNLQRVHEEHNHLERQLNSEANKHLSKIKEATSGFELRTRERDKVREKVNVCLDKVSQMDVNVTPALSAEASKWSQKLATSEGNLHDAGSRLASAQQEFNEKMPRILADYKLMTSNSTSTMRELLIKLADIVTTTHVKSNQVMQRLKMDLAASTLTKQDELHVYDPSLKDVLESIAQGKPQQLDMSVEASAGLAASLPSRVPNMPQQFAQAVGKETCVWFNAFSGRMYRDTARSDYFHKWFCEKAAKMLNKDRRPGYIDEFKVSDVVFGSIPPLLCNMQWVPGCGSDGSDPEYDISCTADMAFRSGLKFTISTRLWLNWPMDRFAFIPIVINLEISEFTGRVRFGVRRRRSFLSFVGEPYSRFTVHSEVGNQYKMKNVPKLSSMIIKKIKKHIRTKLIHPNSYEFRLVWPKNWWPGGPDGDKPDDSSSATATATTTVNTNTTISTTPTDIINSDGGGVTTSVMEDGTAHTTSLDMYEDDGTSSPQKNNNNRSFVRDSLARWFQRPKDRKDSGSPMDTPGGSDRPSYSIGRGNSTGSGNRHDDDYYQDLNDERWRVIIDNTMRNVSTTQEQEQSQQSHRMLSEYAEGMRSCVSTTELHRKNNNQHEYPHIRDIFAPIHNANTTPELQLCAAVVKSRPRAHSINDFRSSSLSDLLVQLFLDRDATSRNIRADSRGSGSGDTNNLTSSSVRAFDDSDIDVQSSSSRTTWLDKLRNNRKLASRLVDLKTRLSRRMSTSETGKPLSPQHIATTTGNDKQQQQQQSAFATSFNLLRQDSKLQNETVKKVQEFLHNTESRERGSSSGGNGSGTINGAGAGVAVSRTSLFKFGKKILEAKETLKNGITKTVERRKKNRTILGKAAMACVSYQAEDHEMEDSGDDEPFSSRASTGTGGGSGLTMEDFSRPRLSSPAKSDALQKSSSRDTPKSAQKDPEQEAMSLAWQARAQAMSLAAEDGQQPSMQGFLRTPLRTSPKMWVVLRAGSLAIYNDPSDCQAGAHRIVYSLSDCLCRPLDQPNSFELGMMERGKGRCWLSFWAESDVQCKAWVMAVQHSANIPI